MPDRADAHIHLFEHGYRGGSFSDRPGVHIDELACMPSLMEEHQVVAALVVGYEGEPWAAKNNEYLARVIPAHDWLYATAFFQPSELDVAALEQRARQGFAGISLYLFSASAVAALNAVESEVWAWLCDRRWLISVNARGAMWDAWRPVLDQHPKLRVLISHLGLPASVSAPPGAEEAREGMASVLALADYPGPRIKLSGLYALGLPGHEYPNRPAWPYIRAAAEQFGSQRVLWGSDFPACLDWLSYPQTCSAMDQMDGWDASARDRIQGGNLLELLSEIVR